MINPFDIYPPVTLKKYPFLKENKYFEYVIYLTPSQIENFGNENIITLDYTSNLPFKVFLTNSQIKKIELAKKLNTKVDLKFSKTQFKKTLPYVTSINKRALKQRYKDKIESLKKENAKKAKRLNILKLQNRLETLKKENAKKAKRLKLHGRLETLKKDNAQKLKDYKLKKNELDYITFIKNTREKALHPDPKPKKKMSDLWSKYLSERQKYYI